MTAPEQPTPTNRQAEDRWAAKLWLWKNGDHYLAFDSECPTYDGGDPKTLGEPVGYALLEWETYDRMTEQVAAQRAAEAVPPHGLLGLVEKYSAAAPPPPGDAGERARELMREAQEACGIYHTGTVGKIIALVQSERTAAASEIENLQSDLDNLNTYSAAQKQGFADLCAAIGVERGRDRFHEFIARVKAHMDAAASQARREAVEVAERWERNCTTAGDRRGASIAHNIALNIRALATPQESA